MTTTESAESAEVTTVPLPRSLAWSLGSGTVLSGLNSALIAVALIPITDHYGSAAAIPWLISSFYIASAVGSPAAGRLADRFGPRRVYLSGLAIVLLASLSGPFAPTAGWLVADRVLLALGTSVQFPAAMAIVRREADRRSAAVSSAIGVIALCGQTTAALAPSLGGLLVMLVGWQGIFWVNLPLVVNSLLWVWFCTPPDPERRPDAPKAPLLDVRLFVAHPQIATTCLRGMITFIAFYTVFYGLPQWLQVGRGLDPAQAGLLMFPVFGVGVLSTLAATRMARRRSPEVILTVGNSAFILAGLVLIGTAGPESSLLLLALAAALLGIPTGFNNLGNQITLHHAAPARVAGGASGLYRTFQYLGAALSAVLVAHLVPATDGGGSATLQAGVRHIGLVLVVIGTLLLTATLVRQRRKAVGLDNAGGRRSQRS